MGRGIIRHPCLRCGKTFFTKPKKLSDGNWKVNQYCQKCRHKNSIEQRSKGAVTIKVVSKVNLRQEVRRLIWLENRHPKLIKRIRRESNGKGKKEKKKGKGTFK